MSASMLLNRYPYLDKKLSPGLRTGLIDGS